MRKYNICVRTALAAFALALSACSSDNDIVENNPVNPETPVSNNEQMTFSASMDAGNTTRTTFSTTDTGKKNNTVWAQNDQIKIANLATITATGQDDYPRKNDFKLDDRGEYTKEETFTGKRIKSNGDGTDDFFACYPACNVVSETNKSTGFTYVVGKYELKTVQKAIVGTYDQDLHFMTAYSNTTTFSFKNVCALLKIKLKNNTSISRVKVVANPNLTALNSADFTYANNIAGTFDAKINNIDAKTGKPDGTATVISTESKTTHKTYVELRVDGEEGDGTAVMENGIYYLVVMPASLPNGFTLLLETAPDANNNTTIYQRVGSLGTFERNKIYDLGEFDCSGTPEGMTALTNVVDLGLPSGTLWATKNIAGYKNGVDSMFTATIYDHGQYYAWGEDFGYNESSNQSHQANESNSLGSHNWTSTTTSKSSYWPQTNKNNYAWVTYKWCSAGALNFSPGSDDIIKYVDADLDVYDDVAYLKSGGRYCMPVYAQIKELLAYCTYPSTAQKESGKAGARFTSKVYTTRSMWLPAVGAVYNDTGSTQTYHRGSMIQYWTRSYCREKNTYLHAYCLDRLSSSSSNNVDYDRRFSARTIRAVATNSGIAKLNQ